MKIMKLETINQEEITEQNEEDKVDTFASNMETISEELNTSKPCTSEPHAQCGRPGHEECKGNAVEQTNKRRGIGGAPRSLHDRPGLYQLWRSLPRSSKVFLSVCVVQACVLGAFSSVQLAKPGTSTIQDLTLLLFSAIFYLLIVLDAFWHENGFQLLGTMVVGGLNLLQSIVYASSLRAGRDNPSSLIVVIICASLQTISLTLARWAYLGFGWRMYSKFAGDLLHPDTEKRREAGLRLDRFTALIKLDAVITILLFLVGIINGINPTEKGVFVPLILVSIIGTLSSASWLVLCRIAVVRSHPKLCLMSEFSYPICYVIGAAFMFSSVYYGSRLGQVHGQAYLIMFSILFIAARTFVWWYSRLLSLSWNMESNPHFEAKKGKGQENQIEQDYALSTRGKDNYCSRKDIISLIHGAWLLKLPSAPSNYGSGGSPLKAAFIGAKERGRWRYFQLSHDGSTLRWDWRKYILLVHVESVQCDVEDLTVTLSLTLEPDLRLQFPNKELHATWSHALTLLVLLLGNPDGLEAKLRTQNSYNLGTTETMDLNESNSLSNRFSSGSNTEPESPSRLLRLAGASARISALGLLSRQDMEAAAFKARKILEVQSGKSSLDIESQFPDDSRASAEDLFDTTKKESQSEGKHALAEERPVISLTATADNVHSHVMNFQNKGLRRRTPLGERDTKGIGFRIPPGLSTPKHVDSPELEHCWNGTLETHEVSKRLNFNVEQKPLPRSLSESLSISSQNSFKLSRSLSSNVELVDFSALTFGKLLGEGAEGPVYAAWFRETPVAVKRASCPNEISVYLNAGSHDNLVNLRAIANRGNHTFLIMEMCPRGNLDVLIHSSSCPIAQNDPRKLLTIVRSIARGVFHLHTRQPPILHRDLNPKNVFIGHGWVMKIGDFGMARYISNGGTIFEGEMYLDGVVNVGRRLLTRTLTPGVIGTAAYCAPELLGYGKQNYPDLESNVEPEILLKADVYSFGVLLYELLERKRPYAGMDGYQIQTQWLLNPETMRIPEVQVPKGLPQFSKQVFESLAYLVKWCTEWDPYQRPTFDQVLMILREASGSSRADLSLVSPF